MKTITVKAYEKSSLGKDGKMIKGKCLGEDTCQLFEYAMELLTAMQKDKSVADRVLADVNRQRKTDCRNAIAATAKPASDKTLLLRGLKDGTIPTEVLARILAEHGLK